MNDKKQASSSFRVKLLIFFSPLILSGCKVRPLGIGIKTIAATHKKGSNFEVSNYCPISVTCICTVCQIQQKNGTS